MINAYKAGKMSSEASQKRDKRIQRMIKRNAIIWHLLTKIAVKKGKTSAKIRYRSRFKDYLFGDAAVKYLESLGYSARHDLHYFDTYRTVTWYWEEE